MDIQVFGYMLDIIANMCVCVKRVVIIIQLFKKKQIFFEAAKNEACFNICNI